MTYLDLLGIPFKTHGRDKTGMDCYGVLIEIAKRLGVDFPDAFYNSVDKASKNNTYNFLFEKLPLEKIDKLEKYCVFFLFMGGKCSHVGVYLGEGKFIHATEDCGVCIQRMDRYKKWINGIYRIKGIKNGNN